MQSTEGYISDALANLVFLMMGAATTLASGILFLVFRSEPASGAAVWAWCNLTVLVFTFAVLLAPLTRMVWRTARKLLSSATMTAGGKSALSWSAKASTGVLPALMLCVLCGLIVSACYLSGTSMPEYVNIGMGIALVLVSLAVVVITRSMMAQFLTLQRRFSGHHDKDKATSPAVGFQAAVEMSPAP